jgi:hypothetical protein
LYGDGRLIAYSGGEVTWGEARHNTRRWFAGRFKNPPPPPPVGCAAKKKPSFACHRNGRANRSIVMMKPLPNQGPKRNVAPLIRRRRTCLGCDAPLARKRLGRPPRHCSDRCREKAYEERNFATYATARIRAKAIRRNSQKLPRISETCESDFADRRSVFSVSRDLIGHGCFKFDSPRLDPAVARTIIKREVPGLVYQMAARGE